MLPARAPQYRPAERIRAPVGTLKVAAEEFAGTVDGSPSASTLMNSITRLPLPPVLLLMRWLAQFAEPVPDVAQVNSALPTMATSPRTLKLWRGASWANAVSGARATSTINQNPKPKQRRKRPCGERAS